MRQEIPIPDDPEVRGGRRAGGPPVITISHLEDRYIIQRYIGYYLNSSSTN